MSHLYKGIAVLGWCVIIHYPIITQAGEAPVPAKQDIQQVQLAAQAVIEVFQACRQERPYDEVKRLVNQHQAELGAFEFFTGMLIEAAGSAKAYARLKEPASQKSLAYLEGVMRLHVGWAHAENQEQFIAWYHALPPPQRTQLDEIFQRSELKPLNDTPKMYQEKRAQIIAAASRRLTEARVAIKSGHTLSWPEDPPTIDQDSIHSRAQHLGFSWKQDPVQLVVASVAPSSPAEDARAQPGDVVRTLENITLVTPKAFEDILNRYAQGSTLKMIVERRTLALTLWLSTLPRTSRAQPPLATTLSVEAYQALLFKPRDPKETRIFDQDGQPLNAFVDGRVTGEGMQYREGHLVATYRTFQGSTYQREKLVWANGTMQVKYTFLPNGRKIGEILYGPGPFGFTLVRKISWDPQGLQVGVMEFTPEGKQEGREVEYQQDGLSYREREYQQGTLTREILLKHYPNGKKKERMEMTSPNVWHLTRWDENGKVVADGPLHQ